MKPVFDPLLKKIVCHQHQQSEPFTSEFSFGDFKQFSMTDCFYSLSEVALSSDGRFVFAAFSDSQFHISSDYGLTFDKLAIIDGYVNIPGGVANMIRCSDDGKYVYFIDDNDYTLWRSSDYGEHFFSTGMIPNDPGKGFLLQISSDGKYICFTTLNEGSTAMGISKDFGVTFSLLSPEIITNPIAMSRDGKYLFGANINYDSFFISSDYLETFTQIPSLSETFECICSSTGKYVLAKNSGNDNSIIVSNDYGSTWFNALDYNSSIILVSDLCAAISDDGSLMVCFANESLGELLFSTDFGFTWQKLNQDLLNYTLTKIIISHDSSSFFLIAGEDAPLLLVDFQTQNAFSFGLGFSRIFVNHSFDHIYAYKPSQSIIFRSNKQKLLNIVPTETVDEVRITQKGHSSTVARPYKVFSALCYQGLTNPLSFISVFENTIGDISFSLFDAGHHKLSEELCSTLQITEYNTLVFLTPSLPNQFLCGVVTPTENGYEINIKILDADGDPIENATFFFLEIRVYY